MKLLLSQTNRPYRIFFTVNGNNNLISSLGVARMKYDLMNIFLYSNTVPVIQTIDYYNSLIPSKR